VKSTAKLKTAVVPVGVLEVNCYLAWDPDSLACLVVDPGDDAPLVAETVAAHGLVPHAILLTHAHVDHIRAVPQLASEYGIPVVLSEADTGLYNSPRNALLPWVPPAVDLPPTVPRADLPATISPQVVDTPGHTPGGRCYHFPQAGVVFTGDTLFRSSVGRTDLPGGDPGVLLESIRNGLLVLPGETLVYPGHGESTTIAAEAHGNPFLA
jgi:glyoxylase-like metal-dependent hydrolase (beta-lactamase superfamily II)